MTWANSITSTEIWLIVAFSVFYLFYWVGIFRKSAFLKGGVLRTFPKFIVRSGYFTLIIIAILGPSFGIKEKEMKTISKDIYIALDLSFSMNATDVQPSRIEKIKFELKRIASKFAGERIGLIIFSSEAFVQCPITYDHKALNMFVETLSTDLVPNSGTNLAPPLELALEKHLSEEKQIKQSSKVIILISDGEDFSDEAGNVADKIKSEGIKLFTLGIGTEQGSKIPYRNSYKKDKNGSDVVSKLNRSGLERLAQTTNGYYYEINERENQVEKMINDISKIQGEVRDARKMDVSANKYFYFLLAALVLIALDVLITINVFKLK